MQGLRLIGDTNVERPLTSGFQSWMAPLPMHLVISNKQDHAHTKKESQSGGAPEGVKAMLKFYRVGI